MSLKVPQTQYTAWTCINSRCTLGVSPKALDECLFINVMTFPKAVATPWPIPTATPLLIHLGINNGNQIHACSVLHLFPEVFEF